jgi:hypothetical protein
VSKLFANWVIGRGTVDLIGNGYFDYFPGYGLYVDLDGSNFQASRMESRTSGAEPAGPTGAVTHRARLPAAATYRGNFGTDSQAATACNT